MNEQELAWWHELMRQGTRYLAKELYEKAEKIFIQASFLAQTMGVAEIIAFNLRLLATTRLKLGELDEAEKGFKATEKICLALHNAKGTAEAWTGLANIALRQGMAEQAISLFKRAIQIYPEHSPPLRLGMIFSDLGQAYVSQGNWPLATEAYKRAMEYCRQHGYPQGEAELLLVLGEIANGRGAYAEARRYLRDSGRIFSRLGDFQSLANVLQFKALVDYNLDLFYDAEEAQFRAIVIWLNLKKDAEASEAYFFLSGIEQSLGRLEEAEGYLNISIQYYAARDVGLGMRYQGLAGLAVSLLQWERAEEYYGRAANVYRKANEGSKLNEIYTSLAILCEIQGKKSEALSYYRQAVSVWNQPRESVAEAVMRLGRYYEKEGQWRQALNTYWEALRFAREQSLDMEMIEGFIQDLSCKWRKKKRKNKFK
jgi:tetratricopeptide (TPR) repeat protein